MGFDVRDDRRYAESHEWAAERDAVIRLGITDFAQDELGDIVFVDLPATGERVEAGEPFGVVESIKAVSDLYAPLDGTVVATNEDLDDRPELVNEDPFGDGWLVEVGPDGDIDHLLTPDEYREGL